MGVTHVTWRWGLQHQHPEAHMTLEQFVLATQEQCKTQLGSACTMIQRCKMFCIEQLSAYELQQSNFIKDVEYVQPFGDAPA